MPSLRGTADEAELVPPWASVFGRDHLRVVRVGLVSPRQSALGRDHLRVVRVGLVSSRRSASVRGGLSRCPKVTAK
jgi:hypothetical protein